jgi:hypothetical protein
MARSTQDGGADMPISGCHVTQQSFHWVGTGHLGTRLGATCLCLLSKMQSQFGYQKWLVSSFAFENGTHYHLHSCLRKKWKTEHLVVLKLDRLYYDNLLVNVESWCNICRYCSCCSFYIAYGLDFKKKLVQVFVLFNHKKAFVLFDIYANLLS